MKNYLEVEYSNSKRPFTSYPAKLAQYLIEIVNIPIGSRILEVGAGRCEVATALSELGMAVYVTDSSLMLEQFAMKSDLFFANSRYEKDKNFDPFPDELFDVVFTKSFVEHLDNPVDFANKISKKLVDGGILVTLTPDWETNYWNFFDDLTHIKPFTKVTLRTMYEYCDYENIIVKSIRQLPSTWYSKFFLSVSWLTALIFPERMRTNIKWLRWSRELMLVGFGTKKAQTK